MPKRTPQDWESLEQELHAAGVTAEEIQAGARRLLAENRGHQLAETRKQLGLAQKDIAAALGVSIARISQIEHGEVTSLALGATATVPAAGAPGGFIHGCLCGSSPLRPGYITVFQT